MQNRDPLFLVNKGRDRNQRAACAMFAGAGVKGGHIFGVTDEKGEKVIKSEWDEKRSIYPEDVISLPDWGRGWNTTLHVRDDGTFGDNGGWRREGREVRITGRGRGFEGYADLRVIEGILESGREDRWVRIGVS